VPWCCTLTWGGQGCRTKSSVFFYCRNSVRVCRRKGVVAAPSSPHVTSTLAHHRGGGGGGGGGFGAVTSGMVRYEPVVPWPPLKTRFLSHTKSTKPTDNMLHVRRCLSGRFVLHPFLSSTVCRDPSSFQNSMFIRRAHQLHLPSITAAACELSTRSVSAPQLLPMQVPSPRHPLFFSQL
jgi:hypothetical protein